MGRIVLTKQKEYYVEPDRDESKEEAFLSFLLKLPEKMEVLLSFDELVNDEKNENGFRVVYVDEDTRMTKNTVYLQEYHVNYRLKNGVYKIVEPDFVDPFMYEDYFVKEIHIKALEHYLIDTLKNEIENFYYDYTIKDGEREEARRLFGNVCERDGNKYILFRGIGLGKEVVCRSDYEIELERNEILSSLMEDWVYEYNCKSGKTTTISGDSKQYGIKLEDGPGGTSFSYVEIHPEDRQKFIECCKASDEIGKSMYVEVRQKREEGYRWIGLTTRKLFDQMGIPVSIIGKISDIDEKKREQERLIEKATKDPISGLYNKVAFREKAEAMMANNRKKDRMAIIIVDIDNFKKINDTYGHLYGDTIIITLSEILRERCSTNDIVGRFGGDEFVIFVRDLVSEVELKTQIDLAREAFNKACAGGNDSINVTCCIGIALYGKDGTTFNEMLMNADSALYFAKEHGKNKTVFCDEKIRELFDSTGGIHHATNPIPESGPISEDVTEFALELLEGSQNLKAAVDMLLNKVGKRYSLSAVTVREEHDRPVFDLSYYWYDEKKKAGFEDKTELENAERRKMALELDKNGYYEYSANECDSGSPIYAFYETKGIKNVLIYALVSEKHTFGYVAFADSSEARSWTEEEKHSMSLVSKIIGNYLARERAYSSIERKVELLRSHDEVTNLLKYEKFKEVASNIIENSQASIKYAVVNLDIVHFKFFNEVYGFRNGDEVLRDLAEMMVVHNPRVATACRDYADNFILLVSMTSEEMVLNNVLNYMSTFEKMQAEKYVDLNLKLRCGIYIVPDDKTDIVQAVDNANIAKKILREEERAGALVFQPSMKVNRLKEIALTHMIEEAVQSGEFVTYFQPKVNLSTGEAVGAEALARWEKQSGLVVMPDEFIPMLEKNGKIIELDMYVYESVLRAMRTWKQKGYPQKSVSVNMSRHHIKDPNFVEDLVILQNMYGIDAHEIEIEITESAFIEDQDALISTMKKIKQNGFQVSIDDFGKGYSSLSMLAEVAADIVKIDKDFLSDTNSVVSKGMINNVIKLIKDSGMKVVCEGIETKEQVEFLRQAGCDIGQGYYFAKPLTEDAYEKKYLVGGKKVKK